LRWHRPFLQERSTDGVMAIDIKKRKLFRKNSVIPDSVLQVPRYPKVEMNILGLAKSKKGLERNSSVTECRQTELDYASTIGRSCALIAK